jgi:hypothetical protein
MTLEVGSVLMDRGAKLIVHTCAWRANERCFVGAVYVDQRPGSQPRGVWLTPDEAEQMMDQAHAYFGKIKNEDLTR